MAVAVIDLWVFLGGGGEERKILNLVSLRPVKRKQLSNNFSILN